MEKRDIERAKKRLRVRYGVESPEKNAFTRNLSETGLFIGSNHVFKPGTTLQVEIGFPQRKFTMWARVVWARKVPAQLAHIVDCGMGLCFVDPTPEWIDFYREWRKTAKGVAKG